MNIINEDRQKRIQGYVDQELITPVALVTNQQAVRRAAKLFGRQDLVTDVHERVHFYADQDLDGKHVVTNHAVMRSTGFLVGMLYANGLFGDFGITFEINDSVPEGDAAPAMESLAEVIAQRIYEKKFEGQEPVCECGKRH